MDSAIFWTEFAARNSHLTFRSPAADVPLYQYFNLDIIAIFTVILLVLFKIVTLMFSKKNTQSNVKQQSKHKSKTS